MSAKASPKTLHQVRNLAYVLAAWAGFQKGFAEKAANDKLWKAHQRQVRQQNVERQEAARAQAGAGGEKGLPESVPQELHELYKAFEK